MKLTIEDVATLRRAIYHLVLDTSNARLNLLAKGNARAAQDLEVELKWLEVTQSKLENQSEGVLWNVWSYPTVYDHLPRVVEYPNGK